MPSYRLTAAVVLFGATLFAAEPLPGTKPLTTEGDLALKMVEGIHKYLDRELTNAPKQRDKLWQANKDEPLDAKRKRLRAMLGVVDERVKPNLEYVSGPGKPALLGEVEGCKVYAVRWAVLPGVDAEGLLIEPNGKGKPWANVVAVPHSDHPPERIAGILRVKMGEDEDQVQFARLLAAAGCRVLIPTLIDRNHELSSNPKINRATDIPHREFVQRMAYEMGRTLPGYEVQKVLAAVDWFTATDAKIPVGLVGYGDGGMIALYAEALDERIKGAIVSGYFGPREGMAAEPFDRNVWGRLREYGDAELGMLIAPRKLFIAPPGSNWFDVIPGDRFNKVYLTERSDPWPKYAPPMKPGKTWAAPGTLGRPTTEAIAAERNRMAEMTERKHIPKTVGSHQSVLDKFLTEIAPDKDSQRSEFGKRDPQNEDHWPALIAARQKRQFDQLVAFTQKLWRDSDAVRKDSFKKADAASPEAWEKSCDSLREYFHSEVIGKLPEPTVLLNPRSRLVYDEKDFTGYEVMLDVYDDVFAYGIVLLPKDLKATDKRPVVVCQHGLEGTPRKCIDAEKGPTYFEFARRLVQKGYIVYCPQNPYYGGNFFRQINRKANPLKLSMFSFIVRQHQRTLDWLEKLPGVDPKRIGFYGLSYGGKTAMRVPAIEKRYCLSICSGDFNEWIGKNVSVDFDRSYMYTNEYEMYEFNLGHTFNYFEMAALIAPRPFMVERGHDDGVGTDEMVASEYAKVRYLYANRLKIPDRTRIDFEPGGHRIFLKGTLEFLELHLGKGK